MPKTLYLATNGPELKNITLPQYPDSAWDWITGAPETADDELYARVAAVYRVANMSADAVAKMPFAIIDRRGETIDSSDNYQNKVGFMPNPRELFRLWRLSLFMTNSAYGFMEGNRVAQRLRYILPTTIEPIVDANAGLIGFKRRINNRVTEYRDMNNMPIRWMWRLDHTTELLPSKHSEFRALMAAAGVLFYADYYVQNFFQRGGIKPTMLMVKGVPTQQEREKIESIWDKVVHGWHKYLGKVFNAEAIEPHVIGEGIDNLRDSKLHEEKLADVAMAAGMPLSLLVANSANYATADIEYRTWFRDSVIPWSNFMGDALNEQIFEPLGLQIDFRPEVTNTGTEEERERAGAYRAYVLSGIRPSIAAQLVGVDMPPDHEYEELDEMFLVPGTRRLAESDAPIEEAEEKPVGAETVRETKADDSLTLLTIDQLRELELWQSFAYRKLKRNEPLDFPFVCKALPEATASSIREQLPGCRTRADIERIFKMSARDDESDALKELAEALNLAASKIEVM